MASDLDEVSEQADKIRGAAAAIVGLLDYYAWLATVPNPSLDGSRETAANLVRDTAESMDAVVWGLVHSERESDH